MAMEVLCTPFWPTLPRLPWLLVAESIGLAINQQQRQELVEVQGLRMVNVNCLDEPSRSYRAGSEFRTTPPLNCRESRSTAISLLEQPALAFGASHEKVSIRWPERLLAKVHQESR